MKPSELFPPDKELTEDERKQYVTRIDNHEWAQAFSLQQSFLHRKRLNKLIEIESVIDQQLKSLNSSSRRLELGTYVLIGATLLLLLVALLRR